MKISPVRFLNRVSAAYIILFCFVPSLQVEDIYRLLAIASSGIWIITALGLCSCVITRQMWHFILIAVSCITFMFLWRLNISAAAIALANVLQPVIIVLVALISMFLFEYDQEFLNYLITVI